MRWIDFPSPELPVFGLPWFHEASPRLWRLPERYRPCVREAVWNLARSPAGGRIRFATDSQTIAARLRYERLGHMNNMHRIGQMGLDLYAGGSYWKSVFPTEPGEVELTWFQEASGAEPGAAGGPPRQIEIYLPLYHPVEVLAIGLDDGAALGPPRSFAVQKPVLYYGSSITQGACASRPGMSYQAILGRTLDLDHVNLGFSGNGKGEREVAEAVAEVDAIAFVMDFGVNCDTVADMAAVYLPFLEIVRARHPGTPMVCITPIFTTGECWSEDRRQTMAAKRRIVGEAVDGRRRLGDRQIALIDGLALLGPADADGYVDGSHPNDLGFQRIAGRLGPRLSDVLGVCAEAT